MDTSSPTPQKKGLGALAWVGIGCGSLVVLGLIAFAVIAMVVGPKAKQFINEAAGNPTRATANLMVTASGGQFEMIAEDDENKRYTVRQKPDGKLTTIYWSKKKNAPEVIPGDFSAIPADDSPVVEPAPLPEPK
jgi:hypothetical protein